MLGVGSRPRDDVLSAHQTGFVTGQADDWALVNREAHHRMKNTLMLLAASVRRDFKRGKSNELSAAVDRFERRVVAFGQLYHLLSGGDDGEAISVANFFEPLCQPCRRQLWSLPPFDARSPSKTARCLRCMVIASA